MNNSMHTTQPPIQDYLPNEIDQYLNEKENRLSWEDYYIDTTGEF